MNRLISILLLTIFMLSGQAGELLAQNEGLRKAETLILKEDYAQAARECKKILASQRQGSTQAKAHYLLGLCLLKQGEYVGARENMEQALRKLKAGSLRDDATLGVADSYFLGGDRPRAKYLYQKFLADFPHSELADIARKRLEECQAGSELGNDNFSVQVGCFSKRQNAAKLRDELIDAGFQAYILELPGEELCRVRVGKLSNRLDAELLEQGLKNTGYTTKICP